MMDETNELNLDVRGRIDAHLDAIDKALSAAGMSRSERRGITDDVEAQVLEMLSSRAGPLPTLADAEAVLAELDPPEAYARDDVVSPSPAPMPKPAKPHFSRTAILGAVCVGLYFIVFVFFAFFAAYCHARSKEHHLNQALASRATGAPLVVPADSQTKLVLPTLTLPFAIGATILGLVAISQIRRSAGRLCGMGLALFDAILFPLLLLDIAIFCFFYFLGESVDGLNIEFALAATVLICLVVDFLLVRWAWRSVKKPHPASA